MPKTDISDSRKVYLFGIPVDALTKEEILNRIHTTILSRDYMHIGVVNAAKIVNMQDNDSLYDAVLKSDLILPDGAAVVLASKILGCPLPERVTGIDLMYKIFERGNFHNYRVYLLGATEEISCEVAKRLSLDYPGVILVGRRNGYFSDLDEPDIAKDIAESKPDVLLVAITSPKKEQFMARWGNLIRVPVVHGVGGSFDVMAGKVKRAPIIWQNLGMEWLYRVLQEPRRLWRRYLVTNTLFLLLLTKELFKKTSSGKKNKS